MFELTLNKQLIPCNMHSMLFVKPQLKMFLKNLLNGLYCTYVYIVNSYFISISHFKISAHFPDWIYLNLYGQVYKAPYIYAFIVFLIIIKELNVISVLPLMIYSNSIIHNPTTALIYFRYFMISIARKRSPIIILLLCHVKSEFD